jgi:hypothetical protein
MVVTLLGTILVLVTGVETRSIIVWVVIISFGNSSIDKMFELTGTNFSSYVVTDLYAKRAFPFSKGKRNDDAKIIDKYLIFIL